MTVDTPPPHGIFIKWGKFQAGAFGLPAVVTIAIALVAFGAKWLGVW